MLFLCNVPLFHIYKNTSVGLKQVNTVNQWQEAGFRAFWQPRFSSGTTEQGDIEHANMLILHTFPAKPVFGTHGTNHGTKPLTLYTQHPITVIFYDWRPFMHCSSCAEPIDPRRSALGFVLCLSCGEREARQVRHIVQIPYSKGAYQYIHNPDDLKITNPKRQPQTY